MEQDFFLQNYLDANPAIQNKYTFDEFVQTQQPVNQGIGTVFESLQQKKNDFSNNLAQKKEKKGISNLLKSALSFAIPGYNFITSGGLSGLNQQFRQSDFGQATSLADYLDMQRYGGAQGRRDAAAVTMAQARGLQKQMAQRPSAAVSYRDTAMGGGGAAQAAAAQATANRAAQNAGISAARGSNYKGPHG